MDTLKTTSFESNIIDNAEAVHERMSYEEELRYLRSIFNDSEDDHVIINARLSIDRTGNVAKNPLKRAEYLMCTSIVLVCRAAINAGLDATRAFAVSDLYMQRLEMCRTEKEMYSIYEDMRRSYSDLVKKAKSIRSKSSYVERCKVYVTSNLYKPFTLDDLANKIGTNKSYLSRKFKEEVNMGIKQYTLMKRIEAAAKMLRYSDTDISDIANYLCFTSQSHFGQIFKKHMGVTPQAYRNNERIQDVIQ